MQTPRPWRRAYSGTHTGTRQTSTRASTTSWLAAVALAAYYEHRRSIWESEEGGEGVPKTDGRWQIMLQALLALLKFCGLLLAGCNNL